MACCLEVDMKNSMTSLTRLSLSVFLATGAVVGCGDDGADSPIVTADAGPDGGNVSVGESTSSVDTSSSNPGTPTDETTEPGETADATQSDVETTDVETTDVDSSDTLSTTDVDTSVGVDGGSGETTGGDVSDTSSETCGAQGAVCCPAGGRLGTCDDGFVCNNPPGGGLTNSECVVATPVGDGGDVTSAPACGAEGELCCSSGGFGGTCDEGFVCNNPAGGGLSNSECVVETPVTDAGGAPDAATSEATSEADAGGAVDAATPEADASADAATP
jgi:hypothetical protein